MFPQGEAIEVRMVDVGRTLLVVGLVLAALGVLLLVSSRVGLGRLPGDLRFGSDNLRVYVPVGTSIVLSLLATIVLNLFLRR